MSFIKDLLHGIFKGQKEYKSKDKNQSDKSDDKAILENEHHIHENNTIEQSFKEAEEQRKQNIERIVSETHNDWVTEEEENVQEIHAKIAAPTNPNPNQQYSSSHDKDEHPHRQYKRNEQTDVYQ